MKYFMPGKLNKRIILTIGVFIAVTWSTVAQDVDSLAKVVDKVLNSQWTTNKLNRTDSVLLKTYLDNASQLSGADPDASLLFIRKALRLSFRNKTLKYISISLELYGNYFLSREQYWQATTCYVAGLKLEEKQKDEMRIADLNDKLGTVYYYMEIFNKSLQYNEKALAIYRNYKDTLGIAKVLSHIGSLHSSREYCEKRNETQKLADFTTAIRYYEQAVRLYQLLGNIDGFANGYQNIAAVYNKLKKPETALWYSEKALEYYRKTNNPEGIVGTLYTLGKTYDRLKKHDQATRYFKESEAISLKNKSTGGIQYLYEAIAQNYKDAENYRDAYNYYVKYMTIRDSVYNAEKSKQVFELETRYQSEKKEKEILQLTAEKKKRNVLIYSLLGIGVFLLVLGYSIFRNLRKNKIIAEQKLVVKQKEIAELEKERQLIATRSVLQGEESERARLANDLHDGLGGMLSGVKINLSSMKEDAVMTSDNVVAFNHALNLLDNSISELRRVAHNLMPETLVHFGLVTAIREFISQVSPATAPKIGFSFFGTDQRYVNEIELTTYRITQELVNNALKHASATQIYVQLFAEEIRVSVQVSDNGKGFNPADNSLSSEGKGLVNIRNRVTALKGTFDISSKPGQGTEIIIEFQLSLLKLH